MGSTQRALLRRLEQEAQDEDEPARPRDEGETSGPEKGHRLPGGPCEADGLGPVAEGGPGDRHGCGGSAERYVVGERLDNSGMRWIEERAEAVLLLRCIEVNGDWEAFMRWSQERLNQELELGQVVQIRSKKPIQLPEAA